MSSKKYYIENREERLKKSRAYYYKNREKILAYSASYSREKRKDPVFLKKESERGKIYSAKNKEKIRTRNKELNLRYRIKLLEILGGVRCIRCGFSDYRALQVDHINGGGRKDYQTKRELKSPKGYIEHVKKDIALYQVLCANCNWIKKCENNENYKGKNK